MTTPTPMARIDGVRDTCHGQVPFRTAMLDFASLLAHIAACRVFGAKIGQKGARQQLLRGLLRPDSPQGKVRMGPPQNALRFPFPWLWREAVADTAKL